jgi:hypothetical protein
MDRMTVFTRHIPPIPLGSAHHQPFHLLPLAVLEMPFSRPLVALFSFALTYIPVFDFWPACLSELS